MNYQDEAYLNSVFTPRSFFFPHIEDLEKAERFYLGASKNLHGESVPEQRIQRLDYVHDGRRFRAEVGQLDQRGEGLVLAIFGPSTPRSLYYVITVNRGLLRGDPIMVGAHEVVEVYPFLTEMRDSGSV